MGMNDNSNATSLEEMANEMEAGKTPEKEVLSAPELGADKTDDVVVTDKND